MKKFSTLLLLTAVLATPASIAAAKDSKESVAKDAGAKKAKKTALTKDERLDFIRHAQVWQPTNVAEMDLRAGPQGKGAFAFDAMVTCDYVETKLPGSSRKFDCKFADDDVAKVRYGVANGEVEGNVLATRLLWALGFSADRVYPVRVTCRGCSPDPWTSVKKSEGEQTFDLAAVERKPEGHEMKTRGKSGWAWTELALVDEAQGGATRAQRDALTLLAVFMQHTDSKPEQQRLLCLPGGLTEEGVCEKPFLAIHDVGLTFGHANFYNRNVTSSVELFRVVEDPGVEATSRRASLIRASRKPARSEIRRSAKRAGRFWPGSSRSCRTRSSAICSRSRTSIAAATSWTVPTRPAPRPWLRGSTRSSVSAKRL